MGRHGPAARSSRNYIVRNYKSFNLVLRAVLSDKIWKAPLNDRTHPAAFALLGFGVATGGSVCSRSVPER